MSHLNTAMATRARQIVPLYPEPRSALLPLCHLAQEQDGWLRPEAMADIAELVGVTPAEVRGTATFYDMLHTEPVGRYVVAVCTNIACLLDGGLELLEHAEERLGIGVGATTEDGLFTLEEAECLADCDHPPVRPGQPPLRAHDHPRARSTGWSTSCRPAAVADEIPPHGTLVRVRRSGGLRVDPADRRASGPRRRGACRLMAVTDATPASSPRGLDHADSYTLERYLAHRRLRGPAQGPHHDPGRRWRPRSTRPACSAGAAPGSRPAASGRCCSRTRSPTSSSTATRASRPPSRTTSSSSATRTRSSRACIISAYALQVTQAFIYVRGEFALGLERMEEALNEAYRHGARRPRHLLLGVLARRRRPPGGGRLHLRRGDGAPRVARGQARLPAHQAALLPGRRSACTASRRW